MYYKHEEVFFLPNVTRLRPYIDDQAKEITGLPIIYNIFKNIGYLSKSIYQKTGKTPRTKEIQNIEKLNQTRIKRGKRRWITRIKHTEG